MIYCQNWWTMHILLFTLVVLDGLKEQGERKTVTEKLVESISSHKKIISTKF